MIKNQYSEMHRTNEPLNADSHRNSLFSGKYWVSPHYGSYFSISMLNQNQCFWHTNRQNVVINFLHANVSTKMSIDRKVIVIKCHTCYLLLFIIFDFSMKEVIPINDYLFLDWKWVKLTVKFTVKLHCRSNQCGRQ